MANVKGINIVHLREIMKERGADLEKAMLTRLTPELADCYNKTMHSTWIPMELESQIYEHAAALLFPADVDRYVRLGKALADKNYSGIYKVFLLIPSAKFIISKGASIWRTYYDKGSAVAENAADKSVEYVVKDFSDLSLNIRHVISGNITRLMELGGSKNVRVVLDETNPSALRWKVSWS